MGKVVLKFRDGDRINFLLHRNDEKTNVNLVLGKNGVSVQQLKLDDIKSENIDFKGKVTRMLNGSAEAFVAGLSGCKVVVEHNSEASGKSNFGLDKMNLKDGFNAIVDTCKKQKEQQK